MNGQVLNDRTYFTKVSGKDGEQPSKVVSDFTVSDPTKMYAIQVISFAIFLFKINTYPIVVTQIN